MKQLLLNLDSDEIDQVSEIWESDPSAKKIFNNAAYRVVEGGPWSGENGDQIGWIATLKFVERQDIPMQPWPTAGFTENGYHTTQEMFASENTPKVDLWIDKESRKVVGIAPTGAGVRINDPSAERLAQYVENHKNEFVGGE